MAYNRPTLSQLIERVKNDFKSALGIATILRRSFIEILAKVIAGMTHILYGFIEYLSKQLFVDTAEVVFLERHGAIWDVQKKTATFAEFEITVTGTDGSTIDENTIYRRSDGLEYRVDAEGTIAAGTVTLKLIAETNGEASNVSIGDKLSLLSPIAGVDSEATVATIILEGEDTEDDESYRARLLSRIQLPPSGGAAHDYIAWALAVPGVTRAWVLPQNLGPGTVGVTFVEDNDDPITPDAAKITEVFDYIEARRPVTANINVNAPVLLPLDITIELKPNTTAVQEAVKAELEDLIFRDAALAGAWKSPVENHTGKILLSKINEAVSIAVGEEDHNITVINGGAPDDVTPSIGELIILGDITWQPLA